MFEETLSSTGTSQKIIIVLLQPPLSPTGESHIKELD